MCDLKSKSCKELCDLILGDNAYKIADLSMKELYCMEDTAQLLQYGLNEVESSKLLAGMVLGKKMFCEAVNAQQTHIKNSSEAAALLMPKLRYLMHEEFWVIVLNAHNRVVTTKRISSGTLTNSVVHPREVFAPALISKGAAIIVAHNHPSGDPEPSEEDEELTECLKSAGMAIQIPLLDHVIIGDGAYYSFQEDGKMKED